jgi:hypothetical protein
MRTDTPASAANSYLQRLVGAAALDAVIYEEVEVDRRATGQAALTVLLSSVATGIGAIGLGRDAVETVAFASTVALLSWAAWALLIFEIGSRVMPEIDTDVNVDELLRTIGFASAPGMLRVFGIVPAVTVPVFAVTAIWMLAAMIVAVRHALDYRSTTRAVAVCLLGWVLATMIAVVLGLVFGPSLS